MFWIVVGAVFLALCTALVLVARSRGGGRRRIGDNHNAVQNGAAKIYSQHFRNGGGPGTSGG